MANTEKSAESGQLARARLDPRRLAAVHATGLLDTEVEEVFDRLTRLAVRLVRAPAAFISLVDVKRDFYKSACGFGEPLATSRELTGPTFCHFTVQRTTPLVIPDTAADPRYRHVPTVRTLGVAAYVGVPLVVDGQVVGAFCTVDVKPRQWTADDVEVLTELAASAQREMELRGALVAASAARSAAERQREELRHSNERLQAQALELELQTEELQATSAHLEERTAEAERANETKSRFLSMMSHELRTPLNAIGGYAELMRMGLRGPVTDGQAEFLARIQRASRHLQTIIGEILEFSRLDAFQVHFDIGDVAVDEVAPEAIELVASLAAEREVELRWPGEGREVDPTPIRVLADRAKLRQLLINLLSNAIKFSPAGGQVCLLVRPAGHRVVLGVSDTGRGIPADQLSRVFEPFVQLDRGGTDDRHQGVGLGLAICRELARGMHGELALESTVGVGSTFSLSLPAAS